MRVVVAIGGNALLERGEPLEACIQLAHIQKAAHALAPLAMEHELILCHGNGPQVGLLAQESAADRSLGRPYPLDALGAQTQGMIGYWLTQSLRNAGVTKPVLAVVTQTVVDPADPAFTAPAKFVGPVYPYGTAQQLADLRGWTIAADGEQWRRVVPSPVPRRLVEQDSIAALVAAGTVVVCGGGGGAPVLDGAGLRGVEAVVDKDLTASVLAVALDADRLVLLTDVAGVIARFGTNRAALLPHLDLDELAEMTFPAGSMGPKIEACRHFVTATGRPAAIGDLADASAVLAGANGTTVTPGKAGS